MDKLVFEDRIDGRNLDAGTAKAYAILINKINELINEVEALKSIIISPVRQKLEKKK